MIIATTATGDVPYRHDAKSSDSTLDQLLPLPIPDTTKKNPLENFVLEIPEPLRDGRFDWIQEGVSIAIHIMTSTDGERVYILVFAATEDETRQAMFGYYSSAPPEADIETIVQKTDFTATQRIIILNSPDENESGIWMGQDHQSLTTKDFEKILTLETAE